VGALRATRSRYSKRQIGTYQYMAEMGMGGIDPVTVRLSDRRASTGVPFVALRIGEGRGQVRIALLTPRMAERARSGSSSTRSRPSSGADDERAASAVNAATSSC
jgi:hypothetical protein